MLSRSLFTAGLLFAGLLLLGNGAAAADDHGGGPYLPGSPVYGSPYRMGPVMGGIYAAGDEDDHYGGPLFSPFHGIRCDRRRRLCWGGNGPDARWTGRFFGQRRPGWDKASWRPGGAPTFLPN